jgi:hypothetical protein
MESKATHHVLPLGLWESLGCPFFFGDARAVPCPEDCNVEVDPDGHVWVVPVPDGEQRRIVPIYCESGVV